MLSKDASNALLKTLEEPPPHVIFVLATNESHKVLTHDFVPLPAFRFFTVWRGPMWWLNWPWSVRPRKITIENQSLQLIAR